MSKDKNVSHETSPWKNPDLQKVLSDLYAVQPNTVNGQITVRTEFYRQVLFRKVMTIFTIENEPDGFDSEWFFRHLYNYGFTVIANTSAFGIIPVEGALSGLNVYGYPVSFLTANPLITPSEEFKIDEGAVLIWLSNITVPNGGWLFKGAMEIIRIYAEQLASIDCAIDVNLMNSRVAYVFSAETEAQARTVKRIYDEITSGNPAVFTRTQNTVNMKSDGGVVPFFNNVKQNYIVDLLQDAKRAVMNEFLTLIGIDNAPVAKRERVQNAETESNNYEVFNAIEDWERNLANGFERCNKTFGTDFRLRRTSDIVKEKQEREQAEREFDMTANYAAVKGG